MLFARTSKNIARRKVEGEKPFIDHLPEYINLFSFTLPQPAPERHELWDLYFPPENGKKGIIYYSFVAFIKLSHWASARCFLDEHHSPGKLNYLTFGILRFFSLVHSAVDRNMLLLLRVSLKWFRTFECAIWTLFLCVCVVMAFSCAYILMNFVSTVNRKKGKISPPGKFSAFCHSQAIERKKTISISFKFHYCAQKRAEGCSKNSIILQYSPLLKIPLQSYTFFFLSFVLGEIKDESCMLEMKLRFAPGATE